jgi:hypothetical protein
MKKFYIQALVIILSVGFLPFFSWTSAHAEDMNCPTHIPVNIDIKPGSTPNKINLSSNGLIPVAVLTTQDFNATYFLPEMAHLSDANTATTQMCAGASAVRWNLDDVNHDGRLDLVFFFSIQDTDLTLNSTNATFMAHGSYDAATIHIMGTDTVWVKP